MIGGARTRNAVRSHTNHAWFSFGAARRPSARTNHVIRFVNTILALNCGQSANHCRRLAALSKSAGNSSASTCPAARERNPVSTNCSASELRTPPGGLVTIEPNQRPGLVSVKSHTASSV